MMLKACIISFTCVAIFWVVCTSFSLPCCSLKGADEAAAIVSEEPIRTEGRRLTEEKGREADRAFRPMGEALTVEVTQSSDEVMIRNMTQMDICPGQDEHDEVIGAEATPLGTEIMAENMTDMNHVSVWCKADQEMDREMLDEVDAIATSPFPATMVGRWGARSNAVPFFRPRNALVPRELVELAASASLDVASNATKEAAKAAKTFFQGEGRIQVEDRTKSLVKSTFI